MAKAIQIPGLVLIQVEISQGTVLDLGESEDAVRVIHRGYFHNVPGDSNGGPQGPPIEVQYLGETAEIECLMSKWDAANWDTVRQRQIHSTLGTVGAADPGTLQLANSIRVILNSPSRPMNFPKCFIRNPHEFNMSTKYSAVRVAFEAHKDPDTGVLWNSTVSAST